MKKKQRRKAFWMAPVAALAIAAIVVSILVFADSEPVAFTATLYSDVVRFEADGVASLRVTIYDLSENELWTSGQVMGDFVDWDRTNAQGERLANGYYVYIAQAWDVDDRLILNRTGKVVLLPGDQVELKAAPVVQREETNGISLGGDTRWSPTEASEPYWAHTGDHLYNTNSGLLGIGRTSPSRHGGYGNKVDIAGGIALNGETNSNVYLFAAFDNTTGALLDAIFYNGWGGADGHLLVDSAKEGADIRFRTTPAGGTRTYRLTIKADGNVGIGTTNAPAKLTVQATSGDLIACYPSGSRVAGAAVFRVESDGDVYADGTVYSAATAVGSADVAERINVSEWVVAGDVVEIDPEHAGFFRKASSQYSRRVAGIISTSPGVILGNDVDDATDQWDDNRPVLAIAGRVPVKASTENGPIAVGDLLVSSSAAGVAMKGDPAVSIGAVVGKAMEPLDGGEGVIMAQVTLR